MATIRVGKRGQVGIPAALRGRLGIEEGDVFRATVDEAGNLVLKAIPADPMEHFIRIGRQFFAGVDASEYINALRNEWAR